MRDLMLMWVGADVASGGESDFRAWVEFDEQVKASGAFVLNGAIAPASSDLPSMDVALERWPPGKCPGRPSAPSGSRSPFLPEFPMWSLSCADSLNISP